MPQWYKVILATLPVNLATSINKTSAGPHGGELSFPELCSAFLDRRACRGSFPQYHGGQKMKGILGLYIAFCITFPPQFKQPGRYLKEGF